MACPNTLTKYGVPLGGQGRGGILQPKLNYRFRVLTRQFGPIQNNLDFTQQVISVSRPQIDQSEVQLDSYNSRAWVAGKHTWQTISCTLRDDITNAASTLVGHQLQKQLNHFEQTAYAAGINYKFQMQIQVLDGGNDTVLEDWCLEGCWLQSTNYSDLDYTSDGDAQTIELTIRFDNATLQDGLFTESPQSVPGVMEG